MSIKTINLIPEVHAYLLQHSLREHPVLEQLRMATYQLKQAEMQISPEQGQFMALLIQLLGAKKTLDIGTFTGYSALVVALALPAEGKVIACDQSVEWTDIAKRFWKMADMEQKIELRLAPALSTLQALLDQGEAETFDFIFIDADKGNYTNYYEAALKLLRPGGLIAIDNVLRQGLVANPDNQDKMTKAICALNELVFEDERVTMSMVPIGDGLTLARKRND
jgi:predicted O-methyltransferase YrrM